MQYTKLCLQCGVLFHKPQNESLKVWVAGRHKFCSRTCSNNAKKGKPIWNKGLTKNDPRVAAYCKNNSSHFKPGQTVNEKNVNWRGDYASYEAVHMWMRNHFGKANHCEFCGATDKRMYHWANISDTYLRIREDWKQLCAKCHRNYDINKRKQAA